MNEASALAVFVTPHGFGHAARACAVMEAVKEKNPSVRFEIFTTVPEAFFRESLGVGAFGYHRLETDVGLVQKSPFEADLAATTAALARFLPFSGTGRLAQLLERLGCRAVLCDISPLGIAVARKAGIPSVLVENFTWDWIYEGYQDRCPDIGPLGAALGRVFDNADVRIQAEPVCRTAAADLTVGPVGRKPRKGRQQVRASLGLEADRPLVLVSLGGVSRRPATVDRLRSRRDLFFVMANAGAAGRLGENVIGMEAFHGTYHPDLVGAADALVGKAGYSTIAEVCRTGVPFGYLVREDFRESSVLEEFIRTRLDGIALDPTGYEAGEWLGAVDHLLSRPRCPIGTDGAERIAEDLVTRMAFWAGRTAEGQIRVRSPAPLSGDRAKPPARRDR